jgi:hypothetical protein
LPWSDVRTVEKEPDNQQTDDEKAKLQASLDEIHQMIEKTEAIVEHYTRKFREFQEAGEGRGLEHLFA